MLLLPLPSYAGHWVITLKGSTTASNMGSAGSYTFDNSQVTGPDPYTSDNAPFLTLNGNQVGLGVPAYADPTLSVTATLTWTPDYPGDLSQPPSPVDVLETVGAGDVAWALQPTGVSTDAKDGFQDPITYATEPTYGASSSGKHLYHVNAGETTVVLPHHSLAASLSFDTALASSTGGAGVGYTAQIENPSVMNIIPLRIDATSAHSSRIFYRVEPADAMARNVTFTAPGLSGSTTSQTLSNVSGEFSCNFDESQVPPGSSNFVLNWTPGDQYTALSSTVVNVGATRAVTQATGSSGIIAPVTIGDSTPTESGGPNSTICLVPVAHALYEFYDKFSYSLPVVPESQTIHVGNSTANISTVDNPVVPSVIAAWDEIHYYQDDNGTYGSAPMQNVGMATLPAQTSYFQSKDAANNLFFAPNHNLVGVSQTQSIFFELDDSPSLYMPYALVNPTLTVPIN